MIAATLVLTACDSTNQPNPPSAVDRYLVARLSVGIDSAIQSSLGGYSARDPRAWTISVPDTPSVDWLFAKRQILQRLSSIVVGDTVGRRGTIAVSRVRFEGDTAFVRLRIVREFRCDLNQWIGFSTEYEIESRRQGSEWSDAIPRFLNSTDPPRCAAEASTSNTR